jgi:Trypsin-like peptidase domain
MMRRPSLASRDALVDLLVLARIDAEDDLASPLEATGNNALLDTVDLSGGRRPVLARVVEALFAAGALNKALLDQLAQLTKLKGHFDQLGRIAIDMELASDPVGLLSPNELQQLKDAAQLGQLHGGVGFAQLQYQMPTEVRRRASVNLLDNPDQMRAWFDAANRQVVEIGDEIWMKGLLEKAIALSTAAGHAGLRRGLDLVEALLPAPLVVEMVARNTIPASAAPHVDGLQRTVKEFGIAVDAGEFVDRMSTALGRVCLVRVAGIDTGTGFLVGDDLVLTNHHVLSGVIGGSTGAGVVEFIFDYRTQDSTVNESKPIGLKTEGATAANPRPWLVDHAGMTAEESAPTGQPDISKDTDPTFLDFALVRLASRAGATSAPNGTPRGHFTINKAGPPFSFPQGTALIIVGHPLKGGGFKSSPQTFAIEPDSVIAKNPNNTRVQYRTNTLRGSSGSPVLSAQWELVALHHYGKTGLYNQGIPIAPIAARPLVGAALGA